jgi:hypothetical protein
MLDLDHSTIPEVVSISNASNILCRCWFRCVILRRPDLVERRSCRSDDEPQSRLKFVKRKTGLDCRSADGCSTLRETPQIWQ